MRKFCTLMVCTMALAGSALAEMVDNPTYQNWARYKPGTTITYTQDVNAGGMQMQMQMSQKLVEITPEKAVVQMGMKNSMMPSGGHSQKTEVPAKIDATQVQTAGKLPEGFKGEAKSLGRENIKVGDKEYQCEVTEFKGEGQGMSTEGKSWTTDEVPGSLVKMEMKAKGEQGAMDSKMTLTSLEIK